MKKIFLFLFMSIVSGKCFTQTKTPNKLDTAATVSINYSLMDRVISQRDGENASTHSMLNTSLRICARRLQMVTGNNKKYLVDFFNQVLQAANRSTLSDAGIEENFMRILRNEQDAITYVLKYPTTDLEREFNSGKSRLAPLTLY